MCYNDLMRHKFKGCAEEEAWENKNIFLSSYTIL